MLACVCVCLCTSLALSKHFCVFSPLPSSFSAPLGFSLCLFLPGCLFVLLQAAFQLCVSCSVYRNCCSMPALSHQSMSSMRAKRALHPHTVGASYIPVGFPDGSAGKESTCDAGDTGDAGLIPGSERSPGGGNGNPLQYSCLENPMDRGAGWTAES